MYFKYLTLLVVTAIIALRDPSIWIEPRFWAEEGGVYFSYAFNHPWWDALFETHYFGYYTLFANSISIIAAKLFPLKLAPYVTQLGALFVQTIPIIIILWGSCPLWATNKRKIAAALLVVFTMSSGETWINSINSMYHFSLITFLILLEPKYTSRFRYFFRGILSVAGLNGVTSCILTPLFIHKWLNKRNNREFKTQALILSVTTVIQVGVFIHSKVTSPMQDRFSGLSFSDFISIVWTKSFMGPLWGGGISDRLAHFLVSIREHSFVYFIGISLIFFVLLFLLWRRFYKNTDSPLNLYFSYAYWVMLTISYIAMLAPKWSSVFSYNGQRYFYAPNVIFTLFLLANSKYFKFGKSHLATFLLACALIFGTGNYKYHRIHESRVAPYTEQVEKWQNGELDKIEIWPQGWFLNLKKTN